MKQTIAVTMVLSGDNGVIRWQWCYQVGLRAARVHLYIKFR